VGIRSGGEGGGPVGLEGGGGGGGGLGGALGCCGLRRRRPWVRCASSASTSRPGIHFLQRKWPILVLLTHCHGCRSAGELPSHCVLPHSPRLY
jgi:hypothetical protein